MSCIRLSFVHRLKTLGRVSVAAILIGFLGFLTSGSTNICSAQSVFDWTNTTSSSAFWDLNNNWLQTGRPGGGDTASFTNNATYEVWWDAFTTTQTPEVGFIDVLLGDVTFLNRNSTARTHMVNGVLTLSGSTTQLTDRGLHLSVAGATQIVNGASLSIDGSHAAGSQFSSANTFLTEGLLTFDSAAAGTFEGPLNINVNNANAATMKVRGGSQVSSNGNILIGNGSAQSASSSGTLIVNGAGSSLEMADGTDLIIGNLDGLGSHSVIISEGANLSLLSTTPNLASVVVKASGSLNVTSGGTLSSEGRILVSDSNSGGILNVESGGIVNESGGIIGFNAGSTGVATVTGTGSQWNNAGKLTIGRGGDGTLNLLDGATVDASQSVEVGLFTGGIGVVNVDGSGSHFEIGNEMTLGVNQGGSGFLNITNGGSVNTASTQIGAFGGTGVATINGVGSQWNHTGQLSVGSLGDGTLTIEAGGVVISDLSTIGSESTGLATIDGEGSRWDSNGLLTVGKSGTGTLRIDSGGVVTNTVAIVGTNSGSGGEVIVSGEGSRWESSGSLLIGNSGDASLRIRQGGVVLSGSTRLGARPDGSAFVQVRNPGSLWQLDGDLVIGENSLSEFRVEDGGVVNNINGTIGKNVGGSNSNAFVLDGAQWNNLGELVVGQNGNADVVIASGGSVSSSSGIIGLSARGLVAIDGVGSTWISSGDLVVGDEGEAQLNILTGAIMSNVNAVIGKTNDSISAEVAVNGLWSNSGNLTVSSGGNASLEISGGGLVTVGGTTAIGTNGTVSLSSGRFEFGTTTLPEFNRIVATGGSMSGIITHSDFSDVASLTSLQNSDVDLNDVTLENSGTLFGNASLNTSLFNTAQGEVEAAIGERMRITGSTNRNEGEFNLFGGQVRFDQDLTNADSGFIGGNGVLNAKGGLTNQGVMAFSGSTNILGDVNNVDGGQIVTSGGATTTFFDDLVHNGGEIRTSEDSKTVIFGAATGAGAYTGAGTVFFEGDLRPGNSPAAVDFEGSVVFGDSLFSEFELGGTLLSQFDRLNIDQDLFLGGELSVSLIDDFQLAANQQFLIADVGGSRFGLFNGLSEGSLLGNFGGQDLFITYHAGSNGSGVALFTAVPEPDALVILAIGGFVFIFRRRRFDPIKRPRRIFQANYSTVQSHLLGQQM